MEKPHNPFVQLVLMHIREFYRLPEALFWTFVFPILLAGLLGLAFSSDEIPPKPIAIIKRIDSLNNLSTNNSKNSPINNKKNSTLNKLALKLENIAQLPDFKVVYVNSYQESLLALRKGTVNLIIEPTQIISDFTVTDSLIFHFDKKNEAAQNTYLLLQNKLLQHSLKEQPFRMSEIKTQGSRYIDYFIPGLLAMGIMNSALWGLGYSLVDFRVKKLMRRMIATPLPRWIFLFSHFITRYLFAFLEMTSVAIFAYFAFHVQVTGSFLALMLLFSAGLWAFSGIAVLISARTSSLTVANGLINAVYLPMSLASGIFFNYHGFPDWLITIIEMLPLTMLANGFREVYNEGAGIIEILPQCGILTAIGFVCFGTGLRIYKWY